MYEVNGFCNFGCDNNEWRRPVRSASRQERTDNMTEIITLDIQLRAFLRREKRNRWIATCPKIDVVTQGVSAEDAKRQLDDAVHGWFEDCLQRGTLDAALIECGFRRVAREEAEALPERVVITLEQEHDVRGDEFEIHVVIPAYQAAVLMASA
jgi:predicted RNase H-like HicB family nuclease